MTDDEIKARRERTAEQWERSPNRFREARDKGTNVASSCSIPRSGRESGRGQEANRRPVGIHLQRMRGDLDRLYVGRGS